MAKARDDIAQVAMASFAGLDELKMQVEFSHDDMIQALAAAMAQMSDEDQERFRAAINQIEDEMPGRARKNS